MSKEHTWKKFDRRLASNYSSANKVSILADHSLLAWEKTKLSSMIQLETSLGMRRQSFLDKVKKKILLSPVQATPTNTFCTIDFGRKKVFKLTFIVAEIRRLKSGKAAGEDKIRLEMSNALNREEMRWLKRVCQES